MLSYIYSKGGIRVFLIIEGIKDMEGILIMLFVMLIFCIVYIYLLKRELRRVCRNIKNVKQQSGNQLLHCEFSSRELVCIINEINFLLKK